MAQVNISLGLEGTTLGRISENIDKGEAVVIKAVANEFNGAVVPKLLVEKEGKSYTLAMGRLNRISIDLRNGTDFWRMLALEQKVYHEMIRNGQQYAMRRELAEEAIEYLHRLESEQLLYQDLHLELYLSNLLNRICPTALDDLRNQVLQVRIVKDRVPHIELFPNGMLFLSTGLLSALESEEQVIGLMAEEVAHYVLDHAVQNINAEIKRERRAAFWAGVATVAAAATDVYLASQDEYYVPGALTESVAILSVDIAQSINRRMGMAYTQLQEVEAHTSAARYLRSVDIDPQVRSEARRNVEAYLRLVSREDLGNIPEQMKSRADRKAIKGISEETAIDMAYERRITSINAFNAQVAFYDGDWELSRALLNRNIQQGYESMMGYYTLALATLYQFENAAKAREALNLLRRALKVDPEAYFVHKVAALAYERVGEMAAAYKSLQRYQAGLEEDFERLGNVRHPDEWLRNSRFLQREQQWTKDMLWRLGLEDQ